MTLPHILELWKQFPIKSLGNRFFLVVFIPLHARWVLIMMSYTFSICYLDKLYFEYHRLSSLWFHIGILYWYFLGLHSRLAYSSRYLAFFKAWESSLWFFFPRLLSFHYCSIQLDWCLSPCYLLSWLILFVGCLLSSSFLYLGLLWHFDPSTRCSSLHACHLCLSYSIYFLFFLY